MYHLEKVSLKPRARNAQPPTPTESMEGFNAFLEASHAHCTDDRRAFLPSSTITTVIEGAGGIVHEVLDNPSADNRAVIGELGEFSRTILTSEALSLAGLRHFIFATGGKVGLLVSDRYNADSDNVQDLLLFPNTGDPKKREQVTSVAVGSALVGTTAKKLAFHATEHPVVATIDTYRLAHTAGYRLENLLDESSWLQVGPGTVDSGIRTWGDRQRRTNSHRLLFHVFSSASGRQMLTQWGALRKALSDGKSDRALEVLEGMEHIPVVDARLPHSEIVELSEALCREGRPGEAIRAVVKYFTKVFRSNSDPRLHLLEKTLYNKITNQRQSESIAQRGATAGT